MMAILETVAAKVNPVDIQLVTNYGFMDIQLVILQLIGLSEYTEIVELGIFGLTF